MHRYFNAVILPGLLITFAHLVYYLLEGVVLIFIATMIYFTNVTKTHPNGTTSLDTINLTVSQGEFVSVVGHSGAGKTTLLKMILAEEKPTDGTVSFNSIDIHRLTPNALVDYRRQIGVVFQDFRLLPNLTAAENIRFAMEAVGKSDEEIESDVPHVLELVNLLDRANHFPEELSGGEKQRLAIARAIINQPEVILADEPTGNLDPEATKEIIEILKKINSLGTTVILTTHNKSVIESAPKRLVTLEKGKIIRDEAKTKHV